MPASAPFHSLRRGPAPRQPGYDYTQSGAFFLTICAQGRQPCFGHVEVPGGSWAAAFLQPTALGQRVRDGWHAIPRSAPFVTLDAFVLMPDHLHGLLLFDQTLPLGGSAAYENRFGPQRHHLAAVVRDFKSGVIAFARAAGLAFSWQPRYHDRLIRSEAELLRLRHYIRANPSRWQTDHDHPPGLYR